MIEQEGLFDEPARVVLEPGQQVTVQTMWGLERGTIVRIGHEAGYPMAELDLENGDTILIDVARVKPVGLKSA